MITDSINRGLSGQPLSAVPDLRVKVVGVVQTWESNPTAEPQAIQRRLLWKDLGSFGQSVFLPVCDNGVAKSVYMLRWCR